MQSKRMGKMFTRRGPRDMNVSSEPDVTDIMFVSVSVDRWPGPPGRLLPGERQLLHPRSQTDGSIRFFENISEHLEKLITDEVVDS